LKKFIISGGGTGGHIYPAIAIADEIKRRDGKHEVLFVGAEGKMEMEKVPKAGYQIVGLPMRGLQRKLTLANLSVPFRLLGSLWQARRILRDFGPDAVVGVGGYASGAVMQVAAWSKVPILIQEQNSYAGLTNKLLAKSASKICVAYPNMQHYFPVDKIVFCGNPVRRDLQDLSGLRAKALAHFGLADHQKTLLVIGGSLGARTINECLKTGVAQLLAAGHQVIWQTGKGYWAKVQAEIKAQPGLFVSDFIYDMNLAYAAADVVVSRAGALSISELCLTAKPAILVPSPNVAENHQTKNALALADRNAALLVRDEEASQKLLPTALALLADQERQQQLSDQVRQLAKPEAAREIVDELFKLIKTK
jgi:UDP-N-acetylglucosamine--N-acetylmuramyl-(pentapeptide) pyrophosphoryl-undecaprenol N-acetylglucosamine transferase